MSTGHVDLYDDEPASLARLRAVRLRFPALRKVARRVVEVIRDSDIPYLGGIARCGRFVYLDRHLLEEVAGRNGPIAIAPFLVMHETYERYLVMEQGWKYEPAHHVATRAEKVAVEAAGHAWEDYQGALRPDYWPVEHENVGRVPPDLGMYPYSGKLAAVMRRAMGKFGKEEVDYQYGVGSSRRCGTCVMFSARAQRCTIVAGVVRGGDLCNRWERRGS